MMERRSINRRTVLRTLTTVAVKNGKGQGFSRKNTGFHPISSGADCWAMHETMRSRPIECRMEDRMKTIRKALVTSALVILGGLSVGGCATTGYVDEKIAAV